MKITTKGMPDVDLGSAAALIVDHLRQHFPSESETIRQVLALAEEAGEFVGAYRRYAGMARRTGPWSDVEAELADVVITAYVNAEVMGIDLDSAITSKLGVVFSRGWRDPR
jgi:NTP pyrophosphatase (non-canonical NTP hydrolase)